MNDIRRTILWVIFGFSMVLLWDQWQVFNGQKPTFFPPATTAAKPPAVATTPASSVPAGVAAVPGTTAPVAAAVPSAIPATPSADAPAAAVKKERIVISNDVLTLSFDTEGGALVGSVFTKYADMNDKSKGFVLLDESNSRVYVAQTGLIGTSGAPSLPTHKTLMTAAYGLEALERHGAVAGTGLTLWRLARCHPWCDGGHDPVPAAPKRTTFPLFSRWVTPVTQTPSKKKPS